MDQKDTKQKDREKSKLCEVYNYSYVALYNCLVHSSPSKNFANKTLWLSISDD